MVTEPPATYGPEHALHTNWCRKVSAALLEFWPQDKEHAIAEYKRENKAGGSDRNHVLQMILANSTWKRKMRNSSVPRMESVDRLERAFADLCKTDARLKQEAEDRGEHYDSYVKIQIPNKRRGTAYEVDNLISHV